MENELQTGNRLKMIREGIGFTQKNFASKLQISLRAYQYYEYGKRPLSKDIIATLMDKWSINPEWLISGKGFRYQEPRTIVGEQYLIEPMELVHIWASVKHAAKEKGYKFDDDYEPIYFAAMIYNRIRKFLNDQFVFNLVSKDESNRLIDLLINDADYRDPFSDRYLYEDTLPKYNSSLYYPIEK
ncbi:MAG: helix-turn-helix domain-containing protein [Magnetococcus sp. YQC-5]